MNPNIKQKWITALKSSNYQQTTGTLFNSTKNSYCCLGVLCKIQNEPILPGIGIPSQPFLKKIELHLDAARELAVLNDNGMPFTKIADFISESL